MLTLALLLALADPTLGEIRTFGDWAVACDNVRHCEMTSLLGEDGDWPEDGPLAASISRAAGPQGGFEIVIDTAKASGTLAVQVDGVTVATGTPADAVLRFRGTAADRIVAALGNGSALSVASPRGVVTSVSLKGSSAALRFIDAGQGRAGTRTAVVAKGDKPAASVPAAVAPPRIAAQRVAASTPASVSPALRAQMDKVSGCDEWQSETPGPVETIALGGGATLALLPCGSGAYNSNKVPFVLRDGKATAADIDYTGDGAGGAPMLTNAWWDAKTSTLSSHAKGRGIGDCGETATYVWDGKGFRLTELRVMGECRGSFNWLRVFTAQPAYR
jgi:hypothetical protein